MDDSQDEDDAVSEHTKGQLMKFLKAKERDAKLLEIDLRAVKSQLKGCEGKCKSLEESNHDLAQQIEALEVREETREAEMRFLQEQLAEAKLYIVKLTETLDLKGAADDIRIQAWDVFRDLYTMSSESESVVFSGKALRDEGTMIVADAIDVFTSLKTLKLSDNAIRRRGIEHLAKHLSSSTTLEHLDLQGNNVGDEGCASVAAIMMGSSVSCVHLDANQVTDAGVGVLCSALSDERCTLTALHLGQNKIGEKGARTLCASLSQNTSLQFLSLAGNRLGDYGVTSLAHALRLNNTLTELNLCDNDVRQAGAADLVSCLYGNTALRTLRMNGNDKMEGEGKKALTALRNANGADFRLYF
eukprot:CAMPEP_0173401924 /NCGR_PEP_ID=MMETSP1356-20130122/52477_1 /TAXON_ID=77927 ORGANISM="Hemiselmis virescens, Strain PCC157" /NCGR_SAMPLE_ID=MMETSP1356 /ASSEMBLY_ACC=CAM_ASM_000847 /LENGTH=357 /DNA_ID=CAMNT_0014362177 /DNA_START=45 /DNA_END=1118 /DNA_ORIENTATION=+